MTKIVFVDKDDNIIGSGTGDEAREKSIIYRIIRIFLFNTKGELLIQKRSKKVPSPEKWDQSVGGHVDEGESYLEATMRELDEELGIKDIPLQEIANFYQEEIDGVETMKRFNTLYLGDYAGEINFNPEETSEVRWITLDALATWM